MISLQIEGLEETRESLRSFAKGQTRILNKILRRTAVGYRKFVVRDYLSGQYLAVRTGRTQQSMIAYKTKGVRSSYTIGSRIISTSTGFAGLANIYERPGGVDIEATRRRVLHFATGEFRPFAHLNPRPFMTDSSARYNFDEEFAADAERTIAEETMKAGLA